MNNDIRKEYVTRDTILRLLSDDEIAHVSTAKTAAGLADGDEYVDLDTPDWGVQRAPASARHADGTRAHEEGRPRQDVA